MHPRETRQTLALCHVQLVLDQVAAPAIGCDLGPAAVVLDCVITTIRHRLDQRRTTARAQRDAASSVRFLRDRLWCTAMQPVARVARVHLSHIPEIAALRLAPRNASLWSLVLAAFSLADIATRHHVTFRNAGPPDQMAKTLRSFATAVASKDEAARRFRAGCRADSAAIGSCFRRGQRAVRVLDAALSSDVADRAILLTQWKKAQRFTADDVRVARSAQRREAA